METLRAFLLVIIMGFSLIIGTHGFCSSSEYHLQKCIDILQPGINFKDLSATHPTWNRTQLDHACSHTGPFFQCYDKIMAECQEESLKKVKLVLTKTFSYLCGEGRESYLKSCVCLNEEPTRSDVQSCVSRGRDLHNVHNKDDACDKIKELSRCVRRAADRCGTEAKDFMDGYMKKMVSGLIDCNGLSQGVISAIIGAVCVTVVLIGFIIRALVKRKNDVPFERMHT